MAQSKVLHKAKIDHLRFILAGRTGSGKSTTGNNILGRDAFKACLSASSVTSECQREDAIKNGISYVIVDTPGLFDTRLSRMELSKEVMRCVVMSSPGPHLFLLTVNVGRFTKEEINCFTEMFELFGENLDRYSLIVFTGKDRLQSEGQSIEKFISSCEELKDIVVKCNNNYISINNKSEGEELNSEIELLMQKIHSVIASNQNQHYTNEMFKEAELAFKRKKKLKKKNAEKKKKEEHDKIQSEIQQKTEAYQKDEIASLKKKMKDKDEEHAVMIDDILRNQEKMVDYNEQNIIDFLCETDMNTVMQDQTEELNDSNKKLQSKLDKKANKTCTLL